MVNSIYILNKDKRIVDTLSNNGDSPMSPFFDDKYVQHLATGAETFEFTTFSNNRTSKYIRQRLIELQSEIDTTIIRVFCCCCYFTF